MNEELMQVDFKRRLQVPNQMRLITHYESQEKGNPRRIDLSMRQNEDVWIINARRNVKIYSL